MKKPTAKILASSVLRAPAEHTDLQQAQRNFQSGLKRAEQLQLAHEVALTRGEELCLAYDNLISVSSGFRTRRMHAGAVGVVHREPCVGFIVKRKWPTAGRTGNPQALPKYLLAFGTVSGHRVLCAVPTDVRSKRDYGRPVPHGPATDLLPYGILVDRQDAKRFSAGVTTCAIQRPAAPGQSFLMSCRHVLSRTNLELDTNQTNLPVLQGTAARTSLGSTTAIRGSLDGGSMAGFDAQLAVVESDEARKLALGGLAFDNGDSYLKQPGDIQIGYWIATGRTDDDGNRVLVWVDHLDILVKFEMDYPQVDGSRVTVTHDLVLHGTPRQPLTFGDSGSPAISIRRGQILIGMYIGGSVGNAYIIPAWQLMSPSNFGQQGEGGWTLA